MGVRCSPRETSTAPLTPPMYDPRSFCLLSHLLFAIISPAFQLLRLHRQQKIGISVAYLKRGKRMLRTIAPWSYPLPRWTQNSTCLYSASILFPNNKKPCDSQQAASRTTATVGTAFSPSWSPIFGKQVLLPTLPQTTPPQKRSFLIEMPAASAVLITMMPSTTATKTEYALWVMKNVPVVKYVSPKCPIATHLLQQ